MTVNVARYTYQGRTEWGVVRNGAITPIDPGQPYKLRIISPVDGDTFFMEGSRGTNSDSFRLRFDAAK